ncbi:MAG: response regulator [Rhizobiaceae bacterium]|nr:response regulator [Rhizobiaceae bacterium]MCV0408529.1 response regulator [Rhizobiaceae bacterium]
MNGIEGLRVLAVEDEALVALSLESMLEELGCEVSALAMRFEQAEAAIADGTAIDAAVLDVNLGGRNIFPIAETLALRGVPFVFATGYGSAGLPRQWSDRPVIQKPYTVEDLAAGLRRAVSKRA